MGNPVVVSNSTKNIQEYKDFFSKYFLFYRNLSMNQKDEFVRRVLSFIRYTSFYGRNQFVITPEVKLLVAASAVQLTFGFKKFLWPTFRRIIIYPESFLNRQTQQFHKGEVNPAGVIVLSWNNFIKGYADPHDKLNLGLHEMAHAFFLNTVYTNLHDPNLDDYLSKVIQISNHELAKIKNGEVLYFRKYASTNIHEFFSVSMEYFFESPVEFNEKLPGLYRYFCLLLNQDPANNISRGLELKKYFPYIEDNAIEHSELKPDQIIKPGTSFMFTLIPCIFVSVIVAIITNGILNLWNTISLSGIPTLAGVITAYFYITYHYVTVGFSEKRLFIIRPWFIFSKPKTAHIDNILHVDLAKHLHVVYLNNYSVYSLETYYYFNSVQLKELKQRLLTKGIVVKDIRGLHPGAK